MAFFSHRRHNQAIVQAELAGHTTFRGSPCRKDPLHVDKDGTSLRDTVRKSCKQCETVRRGKRSTKGTKVKIEKTRVKDSKVSRKLDQKTTVLFQQTNPVRNKGASGW